MIATTALEEVSASQTTTVFVHQDIQDLTVPSLCAVCSPTATGAVDIHCAVGAVNLSVAFPETKVQLASLGKITPAHAILHVSREEPASVLGVNANRELLESTVDRSLVVMEFLELLQLLFL
jgi:hypothetical protein